MKSPANSVPPAERSADSAQPPPGQRRQLAVPLDPVAQVDEHRLALGAGHAEPRAPVGGVEDHEAQDEDRADRHERCGSSADRCWGIAITVITPIMPTNGGSWRGSRKRLPSISGSTTSVIGNRSGTNTRTIAQAPASATSSASARSGERPGLSSDLKTRAARAADAGSRLRRSTHGRDPVRSLAITVRRGIGTGADIADTRRDSCRPELRCGSGSRTPGTAGRCDGRRRPRHRGRRPAARGPSPPACARAARCRWCPVRTPSAISPTRSSHIARHWPIRSVLPGRSGCMRCRKSTSAR